MEKAVSKIDTTFVERLKINQLFDRVGKERISSEELDEIGRTLKDVGRKGIDLVVRKLWQERRSEIIKRYTHLLKFFPDDENLLDELIQIALERGDLEDEARFELYSVLERFGVDIQALPLEILPLLGSVPAVETVPVLLDAGYDGIVRVISDLTSLEPEYRAAVIEEISEIDDPRVPNLLYFLASIDDEEIAVTSICCLSRIKTPGSLFFLKRLSLHIPDDQIREEAQKYRRKLSFMGIESESDTEEFIESFRIYAGAPDCFGIINLLFVFKEEHHAKSYLMIQIHEQEGIVAASGDYLVTETEEMIARDEEYSIGLELLPISEDLGFSLIKDAIGKNQQEGVFLPPEYYFFRLRFAGKDWPPSPFDFNHIITTDLTMELQNSSVQLILEHPFFSVFLELNRKTYDIAEKWISMEDKLDNTPEFAEELINDFILENLHPKHNDIISRLLISAAIITESEDRTLLDHVNNVIISLQRPFTDIRKNVFYIELAIESILAAREALSEGYDPRSSGDFEFDSDEHL